jgi:class 3 adenylate cyclase
MKIHSNFVLPPRPKWLVALSAFISLLRWIILGLILLMLAPLGLAYVDNANRHPITRQINEYRLDVLRLAGPYLQKAVPTRIAGKDRTDWFMAAGLLAVAISLGSIRRRVQVRSTTRQMRKQLERWKQTMQLTENSKAATELNSHFQDFQSGKPVDRQELLRVFAAAKKRLDALGREVAFLAVDVVDSTGMKEGEESATVQHDFAQFRRMVEQIMNARGAIKSAWTPDGAMICYPDIEAAVQSGKDIILKLPEFNRTTKLMQREFAVRCGVNAGFVHFDPAAPLETLSDRVIDIAGHMQKHADPNTVAVSRKVIEPLSDLRGFEATQRVVDGYEVSRWAG